MLRSSGLNDRFNISYKLYVQYQVWFLRTNLISSALQGAISLHSRHDPERQGYDHLNAEIN